MEEKKWILSIDLEIFFTGTRGEAWEKLVRLKEVVSKALGPHLPDELDALDINEYLDENVDSK